MAPRRITTIAAAVAGVLVVSLIGILLYSIHSSGTGGPGAFQQRLLDLGGTQLVLGREPRSALARPISADVATIEHRLADRIDPADTLIVAESAADRLIIDIAGRPGGLQSILTLVGTTGQVNFIDTGSTFLPIGSDVTGMTCTASCRTGQYKILFTGAELDPSSISAQTDPQTNQPFVQFEFQRSAQSAFATYTANNIGNYLTITLDNKVIEAAVIQSQITGLGQISGGNMTMADIQNLASLLKYGPLAVPLKVISETSFQPGTPAPTVASCPTATPPPTPLLTSTATPLATPTVTRLETPTPTPSGSAATSSPSSGAVEATPAGPENACATPTAVATASLQPVATSPYSPTPLPTPTQTAGPYQTPTPGAP